MTTVSRQLSGISSSSPACACSRLGEPGGGQQPQQPYERRPRPTTRRAQPSISPQRPDAVRIDVVQFEPDQPEGDAGDERVDDRPRRCARRAVPCTSSASAAYSARNSAVVSTARTPEPVQLLRQHVGGEGHEQRQPDLEGGVAEQVHQLVGRPAEREPDGDGDDRGEHELDRRRPATRSVPLTAAAIGHVVEHDRRDVVEEPLALQDRHQPPRQPELAGDGGRRDRVGRRDQRAERHGGGDRRARARSRRRRRPPRPW